MKKILYLLVLTCGISCTNPEDRATGNPDSTRFNESENVLNSRSGPTDPKTDMNAGIADTAQTLDSGSQMHSNSNFDSAKNR